MVTERIWSLQTRPPELGEANVQLAQEGDDRWAPEVLDFVDLGRMLVERLWKESEAS